MQENSHSLVTIKVPKAIVNMAQSWDARDEELSFDVLTNAIVSTHNSLQDIAIRAVNRMATLRNWLIGFYIVEYEQRGEDRARYGDHLLQQLEAKANVIGLNVTLFKYARRFYKLYPNVAKLFQLTQHEHQKSATMSHQFVTPPNVLVSMLSFSHIREIMTQDDPLARYFYETECIKGTWSVKELRRQIATNLYLRSGISSNPQKLLEKISPSRERSALTLRQPMTFEFLGLQRRDIVSENQLEDALILHLQDFLLELGKGFCFEARQKRIIIDDEYFFADLVFYHRILHCNIIIELKNDEFKHEYLGQLNAYVSYYREQEMSAGDNPPIGILLCTRKGEKMVEYALAGMDNKLFVSTYLLQLPDKSELEAFLINETRHINSNQP